MLTRDLPKNNPQAGAQRLGVYSERAHWRRGDARNIDGIRVQHTSKRRLSANWHKCGVIEGTSVSWNQPKARIKHLAPLVPPSEKDHYKLGCGEPMRPVREGTCGYNK